MAVDPVELMPYEPEERIVWAFRRGVQGRVSETDIGRFVDSLDEFESKVEFLQGAAAGAYHGARTTIKSAIEAMGDLISAAMNWTLEAYTTIYDPAVLKALARAWFVAPSSEARRKAVVAFAEVYRTHHPAGYAVLMTMAEVIPLLDALADWLRQPGTVAQVMVALGQSLGDLLGDTWARISGLTGQPEKQGFAIGEILGQAMMELALLVLGF